MSRRRGFEPAWDEDDFDDMEDEELDTSDSHHPSRRAWNDDDDDQDEEDEEDESGMESDPEEDAFLALWAPDSDDEFVDDEPWQRRGRPRSA